jgi:hypothetical protein
LEGAGVRGAAGCDGDVELLADLPGEGLDIGLARLAFTAGDVVNVLAALPAEARSQVTRS